jgi:hexosaminidase
MYQRMAVVSQKLQYGGLEHISFTGLMLQRISGDPDPQALQVLAAVVQPPEGYAREDLKAQDATSPLNELVDAVSPESETARKFNQLAKLIASGKASAQQAEEARNWLVLWRDNDAKLQPQLQHSQLTTELIPVSRTLSQVASIGLQALDNLQNRRHFSNDELKANLQMLEAAAKPEAVLLDMVVPSVKVLVQAAGTR